MIVNCEECGKKYHIDPNMIKHKSVKVKCKACSNLMLIYKSDDTGEIHTEAITWQGDAVDQEVGSSVASDQKTSAEKSESSSFSSADSEAESKDDSQDDKGSDSGQSSQESPKSKRKGLGIRSKMFILFVLIPIALSMVGGVYILTQVNTFQSMSIDETNEVVQEIAVSQIAQKAESVAKQIQIYLDTHPDLQKEDFIRDLQLRKLAVQKIGEAGYSFLYTRSEENNSWQVLVHFDREMINADISAFSDDAPKLESILTQIENNNQASGYYEERSPDGDETENYIYSSRVGQTNYFLAATSKLKPLTKPVRVIQTRIKQNYKQVRKQILIGLGVGIVMIFLLVSWFGHRLTRRILSLADVAERISVGDLAAEIKVKGRDEIGMLADSISRMQQSVRLSIERLRRLK